MKILPSKAEAYIKTVKNAEIYGVFLYGEDAGVLMDREDKITRQFGEFEKIKLDTLAPKSTDICADLYTECFTTSFFGGRKMIVVSGVSEANYPGFSQFLPNLPKDFDGFLLFSCPGTLDSKSKLRRLFEESPKIASIACYGDEDLTQVITQFFKENSLFASNEVIGQIAHNFKGNRVDLQLELEKLKLYEPKRQNISYEDAIKVIDSSSEADIYAIINAFFDLNIQNFTENLQKLEEEGKPLSIVISGIINHAFRLLEILEESQLQRKSVQSICEEKFIFFKQIPFISRQLSVWNLNFLNSLLVKVFTVELEARRTIEIAKSGLTLILFSFFEAIKKNP